MKILFIHGAPATGKLTVATEISRRTGFKVFHNHLTIDCVKPILEFGSPAFWRLNTTLRIETIAEAARERVDLIHTFCYEFGADDLQFRRLIAAAEDNDGEVHIVLLLCNDEVRRQRIVNESRAKLGKLTDPESVTRNRGRIDLESPLPGRETLVIDTSFETPAHAADRIIEEFGLQQLHKKLDYYAEIKLE